MSYDAIVVGAGISGASTAYHLREAAAKTLLIERGEPASGGTGKSAAIMRQSYSTPLLVRLARASITILENAKSVLGREAGFVQDGYCFVVSSDMLESAKKNVAMQRSLGIVNEWSEGPASRSTFLRSIRMESRVSFTNRTAATPIPCR
jgi:glycine/D-amino acid oxidase-like deaminating enzyme